MEQKWGACLVLIMLIASSTTSFAEKEKIDGAGPAGSPKVKTPFSEPIRGIVSRKLSGGVSAPGGLSGGVGVDVGWSLGSGGSYGGGGSGSGGYGGGSGGGGSSGGGGHYSIGFQTHASTTHGGVAAAGPSAPPYAAPQAA